MKENEERILTSEETIEIFGEISELVAKLGWELLILTDPQGTTPGLVVGTAEFVENSAGVYSEDGYEVESWEFEGIKTNEELH